jgi:hypothetical protein
LAVESVDTEYSSFRAAFGAADTARHVGIELKRVVTT